MSALLRRDTLPKISPNPSFPNPAKGGTFCKGREGGI
jgi:hypothetical protein